MCDKDNNKEDNLDDLLKNLDDEDTQEMRKIWEGFTFDKEKNEKDNE